MVNIYPPARSAAGDSGCRADPLADPRTIVSRLARVLTRAPAGAQRKRGGRVLFYAPPARRLRWGATPRPARLTLKTALAPPLHERVIKPVLVCVGGGRTLAKKALKLDVRSEFCRLSGLDPLL